MPLTFKGRARHQPQMEAAERRMPAHVRAIPAEVWEMTEAEWRDYYRDSPSFRDMSGSANVGSIHLREPRFSVPLFYHERWHTYRYWLRGADPDLVTWWAGQWQRMRHEMPTSYAKRNEDEGMAEIGELVMTGRANQVNKQVLKAWRRATMTESVARRLWRRLTGRS